MHCTGSVWYYPETGAELLKWQWGFRHGINFRLWVECSGQQTDSKWCRHFDRTSFVEKRVCYWHFHKQTFCHLFQGPRGSRGTTGPSGYPGHPGLPVSSPQLHSLAFQDMHEFWSTDFWTCLNVNQSLEIIFEADYKKRDFSLPYEFGSSGIGAYVIPSLACVNPFHPISLWSRRNAASALSLFPFTEATLWVTRDVGSQRSALLKAVTRWSKWHFGTGTSQEVILLGTSGKRR